MTTNPTEQNSCKHEFNEETGYCVNCFDNVHSVRQRPTVEQMNREVAEWLVIPRHESLDPFMTGNPRPTCTCGYTCKTWDGMAQHIKGSNPDFSCGAGIIRLLEGMMKREDWIRFVNKIGSLSPSNVRNLDRICVYYLTTPGKLLQAVHEWCKEHPKEINK